MNRLLLLLVALPAFFAGPDAVAACVPGPSQAAFFVGANFTGKCVTKDVGDYPNARAIGLPNDSISSVRIGANVQAVVCRNDSFVGLCQAITADTADLTNQPIGFHQVSSAKVQQRGQAGPVWGFADLHTHPTSFLAFGADDQGWNGVMWGKPARDFADKGACPT